MAVLFLFDHAGLVVHVAPDRHWVLVSHGGHVLEGRLVELRVFVACLRSIQIQVLLLDLDLDVVVVVAGVGLDEVIGLDIILLFR